MTVKINADNSIKLTRGDTLTATITIKDSTGAAYVPAVGDVIRFAMKHAEMTLGKKEFKDAEPVVTKTIPNDSLVLQLSPNDTKSLDFGNYVYDIQLTHENGAVDTFIENGKFVIGLEVD